MLLLHSLALAEHVRHTVVNGTQLEEDKAMKRVVIFHFSYKGNENMGNKTTRMSYSIFKSKSAITNDFFDWVKLQSSEIAKSCGEECPINNMQIIGL